jgi:hypothetical protein
LSSRDEGPNVIRNLESEICNLSSVIWKAGNLEIYRGISNLSRNPAIREPEIVSRFAIPRIDAPIPREIPRFPDSQISDQIADSRSQISDEQESFQKTLALFTGHQRSCTLPMM